MTRVPGLHDLLWLAERAHDLADARLRGSARPWQQPADLNPEQREQRDEHARAERADRNHHALAEAPAPLHLDVLDLLVDLLATADDLAERVAQAAGVDRLGPAASHTADPEPYLRHAAGHLVMAYEADPQLARYVEEEAGRLRYEVAKALGEFVYGQRLMAICPWCHGGMMRSYTWRVREVQGEAAVVCESGVCQPPEADCGTWHRGNPAWPLSREGSWLADRVERMQDVRDSA